MGNRAVLTFSDSKTAGVGVYLHWNGGLASVLAILDVCNARDYRTPGADETYAMARLIGVCHEFFDGGLSLGVGVLKNLDCNNYDNGVYVIGPGWEIKSRWGKGSEPRMGKQITLELSPTELEQYRGVKAHLENYRADPPAGGE